MRNRICIWLVQEEISFSMEVSKIKMDEIFTFNTKEAHLLGAIYSWEFNAIKLFIYNPEFPVVPQGEACPIYYYNDAKKIFPYLFAETNPILYRKF